MRPTKAIQNERIGEKYKKRAKNHRLKTNTNKEI